MTLSTHSRSNHPRLLGNLRVTEWRKCSLLSHWGLFLVILRDDLSGSGRLTLKVSGGAKAELCGITGLPVMTWFCNRNSRFS